MDDVLHVDGWGQLGPGLNALSQELASRNDRWQDYDGATREVALRIANTTFAQRGWTLEPAFLDAIAEAFGAGVNLVDYVPQRGRPTDHQCLDSETVGRILGNLLRRTSQCTKLFLVNAMHESRGDQWLTLKDGAPRVPRLDGSKVKAHDARLSRCPDSGSPVCAVTGRPSTRYRTRMLRRPSARDDA
jgi:hypothetical protein